MRLLLACLPIVLWPARAIADERLAIPLRPLAGGQMELRGGQGVGRTRNSSLDFLQPIVSARLGVTDRIEIAVPLWITVVLVRYRSGLPLLGVSGGVRYVDWNRFEGYRAGPAADLSVHASSESLAATLVLSARSGLLCSAGCRFAGEFDNAAFGASAVLAARVFDWLVLSLAAGLTWRTYPALALEPSEFGVGSLSPTPAILGPSVRILLDHDLAFEFWLSHQGTFRPGPSVTIVGVAMSWAPRVWGEPPR